MAVKQVNMVKVSGKLNLTQMMFPIKQTIKICNNGNSC